MDDLRKQISDLQRRIDELEVGRSPKSVGNLLTTKSTAVAYDPTARMGMPSDAVEAMKMDDRLMADIVKDGRAGVAQPSSVASGERGSGWANPNPLEPPAGVNLCDRLVDQQDAIDRRELAQRLGRMR